jgi:hypothetical protein
MDTNAAAVAALLERKVFDNIVVGDALSLERSAIPLDHIDVIFAGDIIEHVGEPGRLLRAVNRSADPASTLIVTTPNAFGLPNFVRYCLGLPFEGTDHVCSFNVATLAQLLQRSGWQPHEVWTCYQDAATAHAGFGLARSLLRLFPGVGGTLLMIAKRG